MKYLLALFLLTGCATYEEVTPDICKIFKGEELEDCLIRERERRRRQMERHFIYDRR